MRLISECEEEERTREREREREREGGVKWIQRRIGIGTKVQRGRNVSHPQALRRNTTNFFTTREMCVCV